MTPYTIHPGTTIILPPRYYGSIAYYAAAAAHQHSLIDYSAPFDKRHKATHRTTIADVNGPLTLTLPLNHTPGRHTWSDITPSTHGDWWHIHRTALESAYGRTPYFEHYIHHFLPLLTTGVTDRYPTLQAIDSHIDSHIRRLLNLPQPVTTPIGHIIDSRTAEPPSLPHHRPYYQVRSHNLGFIPGLSILDLIFNLGPEASLWLRDHIHSNNHL